MSSLVLVQKDNGSYDQVLDAPLSTSGQVVAATFVARLHRLIDDMLKDTSFHRAKYALTTGIQANIEHGAFLYLRAQFVEFAKRLETLEAMAERSAPVDATVAFLKAAQGIIRQALFSTGDLCVIGPSVNEAQLTKIPRVEGAVGYLREVIKGTDAEKLITAAPLFWNIGVTGSRDNVDTVLWELVGALRRSDPSERLPIRADLAVKQLYEALFSDFSRGLYDEANGPLVIRSIKSWLPLLKKIYQSEDGLAPAECGRIEISLNHPRLIEFVEGEDVQKGEGRWHLTDLGHACVETNLAEERFEESLRNGTTRLNTLIPL